MPTQRQYATNAARQAAYRARCSAQTLPADILPTTRPGYRRWTVLLGHTRHLLATLVEEMAAYREERSEVWQDSERGELLSEQLEALEEIGSLLNDLPMPER